MARLNFVKKAQKAIYENGRIVSYVSKKGKRKGTACSKLDRTVPAANKKDPIIINKGDSYYWWQFKNGPKHYSKKKPRNSQLTQSNYLSQVYEIQERIEEWSPDDKDEVDSFVDEVKENLEDLKSQTEDSLGNMPDSLKESPTGQLLQSRIDALDSAISEVEDIDCSYEEPYVDDYKDEEGIDEEVSDDDPEFMGWKDDKFQDWANEIKNQLSCINFE